MIADSSSFDFAGNSSAFSGTDSIRCCLTDANVCGEGASCVVYQLNLQGLHVAVKRLREELVGDPVHRAAFRKEFAVGQRLKHDALPVYRSMVDAIDEGFIVMDFIDGMSLSEFLDTEEGQRHFASEDNVRRFFMELVGVAGYLHRKGIIHCDIKPANIMLRHTDRGLMLIDLDKCYSDTLDRTSGGTSGFSNPLESGAKPTAQKDFAAIGKIADYIGEKVDRFPSGRFRRFRAECANPDTSVERLTAAMRPRSHKGLWTGVAIFGLCAVLSIGLFIYRASSEPAGVGEHEIPSSTAVGEEREGATQGEEAQAAGQVVLGQPAEQKPQAAAPGQEARQEGSALEGRGRVDKIVISGFDGRMAGFIEATRKYLAELAQGGVPDRQIREMMFKTITTYNSEYQSMLAAYKGENPEAAGIDVEIAVARAAEKSQASPLMQQFAQAARDTLVARHPESFAEE